MKKENGYFIWDKNEKEKLSENFSTEEFECQCKYDDCKEQKISEDLIKRLQEIRTEIKTRLDVTSGFRCTKHQQALAKKGVNTVVAKKSQHELGNAADVRAPSLTPHALLQVAEFRFQSIGIATNFLHLDLRDDKKRRWNY